ncbi:TetR family transcriptional regulator (plasmid) [Cereibacter sphaeroides WS8N]|uniref:TetR/AcrR family transcriptional regulator n=1 Tax=Cereibacter sphaeroides TaxID=1063 RepID=UPI00020B0286|nr:TetR/AcrR family transcriptional regulator [Cereibacter sphaeroides]AZB66397.1 TetR family transcriptional regulator [Cereibacter sphaeroides]AZB71062.1 TetR family transcriptional regulator [Cereibacter sphaeroides]EGJ19285.1 TetR family transcriptional regulator [Cereibacter sphaeroides WS8N]
MYRQKAQSTFGKRTKTARAIQHAALRLAVELGYKSMTIDMIAEHAGISRRTFFNHYKSKQDAIAGPATAWFDHAYDWFETSQRPLLQDLQNLIIQVVGDASPDPLIIRDIGKVLREEPELQPVFSAAITNFTGELSPLLSRRLGAGQEATAQLISNLVSQAIVLSFGEWAAGNKISLDQIVERANESLLAVTQTLGSRSGGA